MNNGDIQNKKKIIEKVYKNFYNQKNIDINLV